MKSSLFPTASLPASLPPTYPAPAPKVAPVNPPKAPAVLPTTFLAILSEKYFVLSITVFHYILVIFFC